VLFSLVVGPETKTGTKKRTKMVFVSRDKREEREGGV
jgi:hypothetical protein